MELEKELQTCTECKSSYFADTSKMAALCPECSHVLHGYPNCEHVFVDGRCSKCFWDASVSDYCKRLKEATMKPM